MTSRSTRSTGAAASAASAACPARRGLHLVALAAEPAGEHVAVVLAVVHHQDHRPGRSRRVGGGPRARPRPRVRRSGSRGPAQQLVEPLGGGADPVEVGQPRARAGRRRAPVQAFSRGADPAERGAEGAARGREIRRPGLAPRQHLVQQGQELAGVGAEGGEVRGQLGLVARVQLLEEQSRRSR